MTGFAFLLVSALGRVIRTVHADSIHDARRVLGCPAGCYVTSKASHAIGLRKPLPASRCLSCGVREAVQGYERCEPCRLAYRAGQIADGRAGAAPRGNCAGSRRVVIDRPCHRCGEGDRMSAYAICRPCLNARRAADNARRGADHRNRGERGPDTKPRKRPAKSVPHRVAIGQAMSALWETRRDGGSRGTSTRGVGQSSSRKRGGAA